MKVTIEKIQGYLPSWLFYGGLPRIKGWTIATLQSYTIPFVKWRKRLGYLRVYSIYLWEYEWYLAKMQAHVSDADVVCCCMAYLRLAIHMYQAMMLAINSKCPACSCVWMKVNALFLVFWRVSFSRSMALKSSKLRFPKMRKKSKINDYGVLH